MNIRNYAPRLVNLRPVSSRIRPFTTTRPRLTNEPKEPKKPKKTVKLLSDLPSAYVLPDGTKAPPREEWLGGLEELYSSSKVTKDGDSKPGLSLKSEDEGAAGEDAAPTKTRSRRRKATSSDDGPVGESVTTTKSRARKKKTAVETLAEEDVALTKTRTRKKKTAVGEEEGDSEKPKRTRKKATSTDKSKEKAPKRKKKKVVLTEEEQAEWDPTLPDSPLSIEIQRGLAKFPHCILLTRVGQFWECYFDQAAEVSRLLGIKLTKKSWGKEPRDMCGFPLLHLDKHLKTLVQDNKRFVALCQEFLLDPAQGAKGGFERRVTRVITPGTLLDEPFLNHYQNNYLLAISVGKDDSTTLDEPSPSTPTGLAWIDVSTGEFFTKVSTIDGIKDELARIGPQEIVLNQDLDIEHPVRRMLAEEEQFVSNVRPTVTHSISSETNFHGSNTTDDLTEEELESTPVSMAFTEDETAAVNLLTSFLHDNLMEHMPQLTAPIREVGASRMHIDAHTIRALEIRQRLHEGGTTGSVASVVKRTVTSGGTRLLHRWLCSPSRSLSEINARQSLVAFLYSRPNLCDDLRTSLKEVEDPTRIVQRFVARRGELNDLVELRATISVWASMKARIDLERRMEQQESVNFRPEDWESVDALMSRVDGLKHLAERISFCIKPRNSLDENGNVVIGVASQDTFVKGFMPLAYGQTPAKWSINPEFSEELHTLHTRLSTLLRQKEDLERSLIIEYNAPSLTLRAAPALGFHIHLQNAKRDKAQLDKSDDFTGLNQTKTTKCYFYQDWTQLGHEIMETSLALYAADREAFEIIRAEVNTYQEVLRRNARVFDELDVTLGFATLATELNFVRPTLTENADYNVVNGRHPTVEMGLLTSGRVFTPNTISLGPDSPLQIITGPNMAGKSTLLRQTALIAVLAQCGAFVPADQAVIGIVDKLFSRIGARDDLFRDRSTFMVEMLETAEILRKATPQSLVIMDEVGRGTTVKDGMAIAFSAIHHLYATNKCRALFATHFHELADMLGYSENHRGEGKFDRISFLCTDVAETEDGHFAYSYRVKPGVNRDSHGLKVARLAGMPESAMSVADRALLWLKAQQATTSAAELSALGQSLADDAT